MAKTVDADTILKRAEPLVHQHAPEIQPYGHLIRMPIALSENACRESVENLNQLLADTITLRDMYKKHHWQVSGHTFYQLHLLFDKHAEEQNELVDAIASHRAGEAVESGDTWATILASDPPHTPELDSLLQSKTLVSRLLFVLLRIVLVVLRIVVRLDVRGIDRLPAKGPYLICPNHQSYLDAFVLIGALPLRVFNEFFVVGASEYFETPVMKWFARELNVVPVDPDASLVPAMQAGAFGLRHGRVLVLFPEGERSIDGTVRTFKKGAAILSDTLGVPIVPVAIDGLYDLWPRNRPINWGVLRPWRRLRISLEVAAPLEPAGLGDPAAPRDYTVTTERLRSTVEGFSTLMTPRPDASAPLGLSRRRCPNP